MDLFKAAGYRVVYIWGSDWKRAVKKRMTLREALREL